MTKPGSIQRIGSKLGLGQHPNTEMAIAAIDRLQRAATQPRGERWRLMMERLGLEEASDEAVAAKVLVLIDEISDWSSEWAAIENELGLDGGSGVEEIMAKIQGLVDEATRTKHAVESIKSIYGVQNMTPERLVEYLATDVRDTEKNLAAAGLPGVQTAEEVAVVVNGLKERVAFLEEQLSLTEQRNEFLETQNAEYAESTSAPRVSPSDKELLRSAMVLIERALG